MKIQKGQAAMEFLMTYGWALLIVLVAIAVLASFGVFSSEKRGYEACLMGPGISCKDFKIQKAAAPLEGVIEIQVTNGMGKPFLYFFVTVNPTGKTCQGITGYASSTTLGGVPVPGLFHDGDTQPIRNLLAVLTMNNNNIGLPCNNGEPNNDAHCCGAVNWYLPGIHPTLRVPCHVIAPTQCNPTLLPSAGSRMKENIYVSYVFADSSLTHSRQGIITGSVEAP